MGCKPHIIRRQGVKHVKHFKMSARILSLALVILLVALTAMPALAASSKNPGGAYVVTTGKNNRLRVRSSPGGSVKGYLKRGSLVVYRYSKDGWWKVYYRGGTGYVHRSCLTSVTNLTSSKYSPVYDNLRVRSQPKKGAAVIGKIKLGKKVKIVGQKKGWVCVSYKGYTGWVGSIYLRKVS